MLAFKIDEICISYLDMLCSPILLVCIIRLTNVIIIFLSLIF
jgi:hypothetical protein